jgi:carboxypeptidase family protein
MARSAFGVLVSLGLGVAAATVPAPASAAPPSASPAPAAARTASPAPAPAPAPARAPVLDGTVTGPDTKPVAGALVSAQPAAFGMAEPPRTTRTDTSGRFHLDVKSPAVHVVRVEATGLAARTLRVRPGDALKIALDKGGFIEGIVRDGGSGAPAPGVTVEARTDQVSNLFGGAVSWSRARASCGRRRTPRGGSGSTAWPRASTP